MLGPATPILRSFDEARTKDFYSDFLGFDLIFDQRDGDGLPFTMDVMRGGCALHLTEHFGAGTPGSALLTPVDDVSADMARLRATRRGNCRPGNAIEGDDGRS